MQRWAIAFGLSMLTGSAFAQSPWCSGGVVGHFLPECQQEFRVYCPLRHLGPLPSDAARLRRWVANLFRRDPFTDYDVLPPDSPESLNLAVNLPDAVGWRGPDGMFGVISPTDAWWLNVNTTADSVANGMSKACFAHRGSVADRKEYADNDARRTGFYSDEIDFTCHVPSGTVQQIGVVVMKQPHAPNGHVFIAVGHGDEVKHTMDQLALALTYIYNPDLHAGDCLPWR